MTPEMIAERIGQAFALFGTIALSAFAWWKANRTAKPAPAAAPAPVQHAPQHPSETERELLSIAREIQSTYRELRDIVQRNHAAATDDMREEARDITRILDRVESQLGRIEASQRVQEALARFSQPESRKP